MKADQKVDGYLQNGVIAGVRLKCGSGYGTDAERMGLKCGTDGVKMRNGTDMGLKCGTERNGWG
jgi:hypothetical protein